jgi:tetratricopeptide (TPR) repeat protein
MAATAESVTGRTVRAYCATHKVGFDAPSNKPILCASGGHALAKSFPDQSSWEYCCDCQHCWLVDTARKDVASKECPACEREIVRRYACAECNVISIESNDPGRRKAFSVATGIPGPTCPGCLQTPNPSALEHECRDYGAPFVTSFTTCPFCDEVLEAPPKFPSTVAECLSSLKTSPAQLAFDNQTNELKASTSGDYVLLPRIPGLSLSLVIPKVKKFKSKRDYYDTYYELFNCDNPSAGEVVVVQPASAEKTDIGWLVKESGTIEVRSEEQRSTIKPTSTVVVCANCGTAGNPSEPFCGRCGVAFNPSSGSRSETIGSISASAVARDTVGTQPPAFGPATESFSSEVTDLTTTTLDNISLPYGSRDSVGTTGPLAHAKSSVPKVVAVGVALFLLVVVIIAISVSTVGGNSVEKQLDEAITRGNLFPPSVQNAHDLYNQLKASNTSEDKLRRYREQLIPLVTSTPYKLLADLPTIGGDEPTVDQWQDAVRSLNWAIELKPGDNKLAARAAYCEGRAAFIQRQADSALQSWTRAAKLDPSWALPINGTGLVYQGRKDYATSRSYFLRAMNLDPNWAHPYENLGNNYLYEKDYSTARNYYQKALEKSPDWAKPHWHLGQIAMQFSDYSTAVSEFQAALSPSARGLKGNESQTIQKDLDRAQQKLSQTSSISSY